MRSCWWLAQSRVREFRQQSHHCRAFIARLQTCIRLLKCANLVPRSHRSAARVPRSRLEDRVRRAQ
eukprot:2862138-Pyramimonas_sp.AAC.1